jgi:hypothetical protein
MGTPITEAEFADQLRTFERAALRLELQREYVEPTERDTVSRFLRGEPQPPTEVPELRDWFEQVATLTRAGKTIARVRVHEDPPTDYQRWERWIGDWNTAAGEQITYLTREQAKEIGLLPAAGDVDWWLIDDTRLILMRFAPDGRRISNELETDPQTVAQARAWWDLAVRTPKREGDAA